MHQHNDSKSRRENAWARDRYGLTCGQFLALVALSVDDRRAHGALAALERVGLARCVGKFGKTGNQPGYTPTFLALSKFPELPSLAKCGVDEDAEQRRAG